MVGLGGNGWWPVWVGETGVMLRVGLIGGAFDAKWANQIKAVRGVWWGRLLGGVSVGHVAARLVCMGGWQGRRQVLSRMRCLFSGQLACKSVGWFKPGEAVTNPYRPNHSVVNSFL